ncbi:MAG: ATP-dependent metallopeptidase FtsH/Yme1/Tma family protein [Salinisphaera sp.]|jgi:cell division protease FtsH|nr:ATP-dependent metallopeptidase FtsH/Yme1/Tma family protein [Salinisphaera sp.]
MNKTARFYLLFVFIPMTLILVMQSFWGVSQQTENIPYSRFQHELEQGHIKSVVVGAQSIHGEFTTPQGGKTRFSTVPVPTDLRRELQKAGVQYTGAPDNT